MSEIVDLLHHHCAGDEDCAWGTCKKCKHLEECQKLTIKPEEDEQKLNAPECPKGQKKKGCVSCKFYNWCPNSGDSRERREFQSFGAGCCGFSEEKMLCRNPDGNFCTMKKRQEYRCPIRHPGEPPADPSWEEMLERKKNNLHPRTGLKQKIDQCEVGPRHWCDPDCPVEHCEAQYSYAGCHEKEATPTPAPVRASEVAPDIKKKQEKSAKTEKPAEPESKPAPAKRQKKEKPDPICEACRERMKGNVPAHACVWCKEEQETRGRRAWVTDIKLGSVLLGDMGEIGKRVPDQSVDLIFTDPPYVKELWENAYAELAMLAARVLKPGGFLITYAPQAHLADIMDLLRYSAPMDEGLSFFWIISSLNSGPALKAHKWNAICLHKPILVFQNGSEVKGARRCFADVVRGLKQKKYPPWQQSVHDVLGIIDRFMAPGEILLDPYAGWGTTLIAANLLGMEWVGFEIDPDRQRIAMERLQQKPVDLQAFGIEADAAECKRETAPEQKDTSKQAAIEPVKSPKLKKLIKNLCDGCEAKDRCLRHEPHEGCLQEFLDFEKAIDEARPVELPAACLECEGRDECETHDPHAGCLDEVNDKNLPDTDSSQPYVQHCCGTCGHHKGRKTFHESCPRLGELLFKGGTKSAKVLMEETQRESCEHWISKTERIPNITWCSTIRGCVALDWEGGICTTTGKKLADQNYCPTQHLIGEQPEKEVQIKQDTEEENPCKDFNNCTHSDRDRCEDIHKTRKVKCLAPVRPKKGTPEWFAALTEAKRKNNPHWLWEVWKHDPAKGEWLYEGTEIQTEAYALKERIEETRPEGSKVLFSVRKRPDPNYDPNDIEGPCKTCTIECLDDNDGCHEFDDHSYKLDGEGEPRGEWPDWPVCIISCGKAKIWDNPGKKKPKALVYAKDAYTGPLFTSAKNYAEQRHQGPWYILSDKYGLILPGEEIENYDVSPEEIKDDPEFFEAVHHRARSDPDLSRAKKIVLIAGKIHQDIIERVFPGVEIYNPVQGLSQGERMHVLKNLTAESPEAEKPNCGGKRPALNRCPDSCPDRSCEKEGGYPQGRCKQTGQKLREMQTCPNDPPKAEKKPAKKPKPYTIYIKKSDGAHPLTVSCDAQGHGGTSYPCDTREEVIKRALVVLDGFVRDAKRPALSKKLLPVTGETTLFIDKTGLFTRADFFDQHGEPKKPEPKKSASKKSKTKESENP